MFSGLLQKNNKKKKHILKNMSIWRLNRTVRPRTLVKKETITTYCSKNGDGKQPKQSEID